MAALYGCSGADAGAILGAMSQALVHRGARATETPADPGGGLGHRGPASEFVYSGRDEAGADSVEGGIAASADLALCLAGTLRRAPGDARSPAALLAAWRTRGLDLVADLEGDFILAVRERERFYVVRDGVGARTAYYAWHRGRFLFASEAKAVLAAPGFPRRIRPAALAQYLTFSFVPGAGTMLEGLCEIPAGHAVICDGRGEPRLERYFIFETDATVAGVPEDVWAKQFRETFERAVAVRRPRGEPVGVALSGGLDSSVVTAEVARQHDAPVRTYAIHFGSRYPHELDYARLVARRCKTAHTEVEIQPADFLPQLRSMIWALDEPIGDPITMPNFALAERMRQDVRHVFNGEGGDPVFGGPKNLPMLLHHVYGGVDRGPGFRERAYLASYRRGYDEIHRLIAPSFRAQIDPARDLEALLTPYFETERPSGFLEKLLAMNIRLKGAHLILPKVERMTARFGITPLSPLFDEQLVRLAFRMPGRMKLHQGIEKIVLKRAYADDLPPEVIARPKSGMRVPVHFWFQGELRRYARKMLSRRAVREAGLFDPDRVQQILDFRTDEGPGRYGLRLWMLVTLELWRRIVVEGERP
jgi:asparagine synthase (glutamine-hydrolysing)